MLRNTLHFNLRNFLLFIYLTSILDLLGVLGEQNKNALEEINDRSFSTLHMMDALNGVSTASLEKPVNANRIREAIEVETYLVSTYSRKDQEEDKDFLVTNLMEIYQSNLIDRCKLYCLLNYMPKFKFIFSSEFDRKRNLGNRANMTISSGYSVLDTALELPALSHNDNSRTFRQTLSHELNHGLDAFNNLRAGRCVTMFNGKKYPLTYIHGRHNRQHTDSCTGDYVDVQRVYTLLYKDINRISRLLEISKQGKQVKNLGAMIKKYHYQHTRTILVYGSANVKDLEKVLLEQNYIFFKDKHIYIAQDKNLKISQSDFQYTVLEFHAKTKKLITTLTNPRNFDIISLQIDLLENILHRIKDSESDTIAETIMEISSAIDEVLAPYSDNVEIEGNVMNLREWLFPRLVAHQATRMSAEHLSCLNTTRRLNLR